MKKIADCEKGTEDGGDLMCMALRRAYRWDSESNDCIQAHYGGCNPSPNNFKSLKKCRKIAKPVCSASTT